MCTRECGALATPQSGNAGWRAGCAQADTQNGTHSTKQRNGAAVEEMRVVDEKDPMQLITSDGLENAATCRNDAVDSRLT